MEDWEPLLVKFLQRIGQPYDFSEHYLYDNGIDLPGDDDHKYRVYVKIGPNKKVSLEFTEQISPRFYLKEYTYDKTEYRAAESAINFFAKDYWSVEISYGCKFTDSPIYLDWQEQFEAWLKNNPSYL